MRVIQSHPSSCVVIVLLMLTTLILAVVLAPGEADGRVFARASVWTGVYAVADAFTMSGMCLTPNGKGLYYPWLEAVRPTESGSPIYSLCVVSISMSDNGKPHGFARAYYGAGMAYASG